MPRPLLRTTSPRTTIVRAFQYCRSYPPPLNGNTIKDNGRCKIVRAEEELAVWHPTRAAVYRSPDGFPGVLVENLSSITMPPYSNAIDGNGKVGSWEQAVTIDEASYRYCA